MKNNILTPLQSALVCADVCYSLLECAGGDAVSALFCLIPAALCFFGLLTDGGRPLSSAVHYGIWFFAALSLAGAVVLSIFAGNTAAAYYENVPDGVFAILFFLICVIIAACSFSSLGRFAELLFLPAMAAFAAALAASNAKIEMSGSLRGALVAVGSVAAVSTVCLTVLGHDKYASPAYAARNDKKKKRVLRALPASAGCVFGGGIYAALCLLGTRNGAYISTVRLLAFALGAAAMTESVFDAFSYSLGRKK